MGEYLQEAVLPVQYDNYVFDLYGTLVDIHTEEDFPKLWEKLALFFGYYGAIYEPKELQKRYAALVSDCERALKKTLEEDRHYTHEASSRLKVVFVALISLIPPLAILSTIFSNVDVYNFSSFISFSCISVILRFNIYIAYSSASDLEY